MKMLAPPDRPPRVCVADDDGHRRLHKRLALWTMTFSTIALTAWFCTYGWVATILALAVAKHVLVAILAMGLGVDSSEVAELPR
jgi:hypothetical protein